MNTTSSRRALLALAILLALHVTGTVRAAEAEPPIDPVRGRQLMQKSSRGETLTPEEQAYLDRVTQEIRKRAAGKRSGSAPNVPARPLGVNTNDWVQLVPITDMTAQYKGEDGGLYGGGQNEPSAAHRAAYLKESEQIRPLDTRRQRARLKYDPQTGRFVFPTRVFAAYSLGKEAEPGPYQTGPAVVIIEADDCRPLQVVFYDEMPDVEITLTRSATE